LTLILTFSLREKKPNFDAGVVTRNSLSLRERARVRVTSVAMNLLEA